MMKRIRLTLAPVTAGLLLIGASALWATGGETPQDRDLAAVMKVVQRPASQAGSAAGRQRAGSSASQRQNRYLKMELGGHRSEELTIAIPLSLIELAASFDEESTLDEWGGEGEVKLKDLLKALKELGPSELLEIRGDEGWIRVWLE